MTQSTTKRTDAEVLPSDLIQRVIDRLSKAQMFTLAQELRLAIERAATQPAGEADALNYLLGHPTLRRVMTNEMWFRVDELRGKTAQQDGKAGQARQNVAGTPDFCYDCFVGAACAHDAPAAPEGKTEASELPSEWMLYADAFGVDPESIDYDSDKWQYFTAGVTAALAALPPASDTAHKLLSELMTLRNKQAAELRELQMPTGMHPDYAELYARIESYLARPPVAAAPAHHPICTGKGVNPFCPACQPAAPAPDAEAIRSAALEDVIALCNRERVDDTGTEGDTAYNNALSHVINAIRLSQPSPAVKSAEPTGGAA